MIAEKQIYYLVSSAVDNSTLLNKTRLQPNWTEPDSGVNVLWNQAWQGIAGSRECQVPLEFLESLLCTKL